MISAQLGSGLSQPLLSMLVLKDALPLPGGLGDCKCALRNFLTSSTLNREAGLPEFLGVLERLEAGDLSKYAAQT